MIWSQADDVNITVLDAGKQKASGSSTDTDAKLASTGLTEKQLQLSVEVCDTLRPPRCTYLTFMPRLLGSSGPGTVVWSKRPLVCVFLFFSRCWHPTRVQRRAWRTQPTSSCSCLEGTARPETPCSDCCSAGLATSATRSANKSVRTAMLSNSLKPLD